MILCFVGCLSHNRRSAKSQQDFSFHTNTSSPTVLGVLHPWHPPNPEIRISEYKFKLNQNLNVNMYHEIPRNLSSSIWLFLGVQQFQWNPSYWKELCFPFQYILAFLSITIRPLFANNMGAGLIWVQDSVFRFQYLSCCKELCCLFEHVPAFLSIPVRLGTGIFLSIPILLQLK